MKNAIRLALATLAMALVFPTGAHADTPGAHPAYLHALTNLRTARWELEKRKGDQDMKWKEAEGIHEIDEAINEIKKAAIDDGKNLNDHPKEQAGNLDRRGRLHDAVKLLEDARADIEKRETNASDRGLRDRAFKHIDEALRHTRQGIEEAERTGH